MPRGLLMAREIGVDSRMLGWLTGWMAAWLGRIDGCLAGWMGNNLGLKTRKASPSRHG